MKTSGLIWASLFGGAFGGVMLILGFHPDYFPGGNTGFELLHKPALWAANFWTYKLKMPPQEEAGFVVTPMVAIIMQWIILGLVAGMTASIIRIYKRPGRTDK